MNDLAKVLAAKVLLYLGDSPEHALMTFVEDGSTFTELRDLAAEVRDSRQGQLPGTTVAQDAIDEAVTEDPQNWTCKHCESETSILEDKCQKCQRLRP